MSSVASIPLRYSSMNRSNILVKTGFLPILYDLFVQNEVLVIQSYLCTPMDDIPTPTSEVASVVHTATWYGTDKFRLCGKSLSSTYWCV